MPSNEVTDLTHVSTRILSFIFVFRPFSEGFWKQELNLYNIIFLDGLLYSLSLLLACW